jgi:hypothetical protein
MHEDELLVERLAVELTKRGGTVWRDRNNIEPGVRWQDAITQAIRKGMYFLACFSSHYESRPDTWMNEELFAACAAAPLRSGAWMIPVNLDGCTIPAFADTRRLVNDVQQVLMHPNWHDGVARLVEATIQPTRIRLKEEITHDAEELADLSVRLYKAENDLEHAQLRAIEEDASRSMRLGGQSAPGSVSVGGITTPSRPLSDLSGYHERIAAASARFAEKKAVYDQKVKEFLERYDEEFDPFPRMYTDIDARKRKIEQNAAREERDNKSFAWGMLIIVGILILLAMVLAIVLSSL